jgi:hypothetical protein
MFRIGNGKSTKDGRSRQVLAVSKSTTRRIQTVTVSGSENKGNKIGGRQIEIRDFGDVSVPGRETSHQVPSQ